MSLLERVVERLGFARKAHDEHAGHGPVWARDDEYARWSVPDPSVFENQADLYRRLSWLQTAAQALAQTAAGTPLLVKRRDGDHFREAHHHPFIKLLARPNPLMSRFEFLEATFAYRAVTGNAYWWLNRPNGDSTPSELWIIPPYLIKPIPDGRMSVRGYLYNERYTLEPWEVVHFKRFNPTNTFVGLSPVEALAVVATGDLKMQEWNTNLFARDNAKLPGALAFADPINDGDWERMHSDLRHDHGGTRRSLMMLRNVGKGGVQWLTMAANQQELEFLEGRKATKEEVFNLVAPGLASVLDVNSTMANATTGKAAFVEFGVWPALQAIAEKITNDILPVYDRGRPPGLVGLHVAEWEDIRVTDRGLALQEQEAYERSHTIDEVRAKFYHDDPLPKASGLRPAVTVLGSPKQLTGKSSGRVWVLGRSCMECRVCEGLAGQPAAFWSGVLAGAPAHPGCDCRVG